MLRRLRQLLVSISVESFCSFASVAASGVWPGLTLPYDVRDLRHVVGHDLEVALDVGRAPCRRTPGGLRPPSSDRAERRLPLKRGRELLTEVRRDPCSCRSRRGRRVAERGRRLGRRGLGGRAPRWWPPRWSLPRSWPLRWSWPRSSRPRWSRRVFLLLPPQPAATSIERGEQRQAKAESLVRRIVGLLRVACSGPRRLARPDVSRTPRTGATQIQSNAGTISSPISRTMSRSAWSRCWRKTRSTPASA